MMSKTKHSKPDEFLKEQIRHLQKELKRANQHIRFLEKEIGYSQNRTEKTTRKELENTCDACGKAEYRTLDLGSKVYLVCPLCKDRKKL